MQHPLANLAPSLSGPRPTSPVRSVPSINGRNRRRAGSSASTTSGNQSFKSTPKLSPRGKVTGVFEGDEDDTDTADGLGRRRAESFQSLEGVSSAEEGNVGQSNGRESIFGAEQEEELEGNDVALRRRSDSKGKGKMPKSMADIGLSAADLALLRLDFDGLDDEDLLERLAPLSVSEIESSVSGVNHVSLDPSGDVIRTPRTPTNLDQRMLDSYADLLITPRPPPRRSITATSSSSLPIISSKPTSKSPGPTPALILPQRKSSSTLLTLTTKPSEESPLFPPSPPTNGLFAASPEASSHMSRPSISKPDIGGFDPSGKPDLLVCVRRFSRIVRKLEAGIRRAEEENQGLREELAAARARDAVRARNTGNRTESDLEGTTRPNRASWISDRALLPEKEDQQSIHDSLNEALSTSLDSEFRNAVDEMNHSRKGSRQRAASAVNSTTHMDNHHLNKKKSGTSPSLRLVGEVPGSVPPPNLNTPNSLSVVRVRTAADKTGRSDNDRNAARASWTSGLWAWNSQTATPTHPQHQHRPRAGSRSTSGSIPTSPSVEKVSFEPTPARPSVAQNDGTAFMLEDGDVEGDDLLSRGSSPAFRAIFLATRVMTPDPSSVLQRPLPSSSLIAYLAHSLVSQAREEGIKLQNGSRRGSASLYSRASKDAPTAIISPPIPMKPTMAVTASIGNAITNSIGAVGLAVGVRSSTKVRGPGSKAPSAARKALMRTLSSKGPPAVATSSPDDPEDIPVPRISAVELNALIPPESRPPTMHLRRNTMQNNRSSPSPSMRVATQFAASDVSDYTDRYGFVYDMRYVRMLLDLKAAAVDTNQETPWDERPEILFGDERRGSINLATSASDPVQVKVESPDSSPKLDEGDRNNGGQMRSRANTIASFNPSPVKTVAASQAVQISSRGSIDLQPRVPSGNWRTYSGSIQVKASNLEKLASMNRKPVSSLLTQLSEVHDRQEVERQKAWQDFVKDRQIKTRKAHGRKGTLSMESWSSVADMLNPTKSKIFVDDQKWQGASLGISQMGLGKSGSEDIKRFVDLVRETGIPIVLRPTVWWECTGAMDAFVPGEYQEILSIHAEDKHPVLGEIEKDVSRTFPTNVFFGGDGVGCRKLRRLLTAYAWHDPSIGYCQGMNLLAATLLLTFDEEEQAFWSLQCIVKNILPEDWFTSALTGSMTEQAVLSDYVELLLPEVSKHLCDLGLDELSSLTFGWLLSVFTSCLPIETLLRVWDCVIVCGKDTIIRMAMSVLSLAKDDILNCESAADVFECLNGLTEKLWSAEKIIHIEKQLQSSMKAADISGRRALHLRMHALNSGDEVDLLA